jgi:hypothetical protein
MYKKLAFFILLGGIFLFCHNLRADTVVFKNGNKLECKVIPPEDNDKTMRLLLDKDGQKSISVYLATIKNIDYDFQSLKDSLDEDDYEGWYRLGVWAFKRKLISEASECFIRAKGNEGVPVEIYFYLGRIYEKFVPPSEMNALENYKLYIQSGKNEKLMLIAKKAVERLSKKVKSVSEGKKSKEKVLSIDGYETGAWASPGWGNATKASSPSVKGRENRVLEVTFDNRDRQGKLLSADKRKAPVQLRMESDVSSTPILSFDIYNPNKKALQISIAMITGQKYEWFESNLIGVPAGKWKPSISLDLKRRYWKSASSAWRNISPVGNQKRLRSLIVLIYNGSMKGKIYIDNIKFQDK